MAINWLLPEVTDAPVPAGCAGAHQAQPVFPVSAPLRAAAQSPAAPGCCQEAKCPGAGLQQDAEWCRQPPQGTAGPAPAAMTSTALLLARSHAWHGCQLQCRESAMPAGPLILPHQLKQLMC